jgi:hypothetical protein
VLSLLLALLPDLAAAQPPVTVKVDRRVELLSIVARLAGYEEYSGQEFKTYVDDVNRHFEKHRGHAAVEYARQIRRSNNIAFDAVMGMAVHLDAPPALAPRVRFDNRAPDARYGRETAEQFARLLRQFYVETDSEGFFKAHAELYRIAETRFQALLERVDFSWYHRFYGEMPNGAFNLYLGLLNGGGNYGPKVIHPDGREDLYAIIGTWRVDEAGLPLYDDRMVTTIIHEFNHSFVNHLVYASEARLREPGEKVYAPVASKMKELAYGNWQTMLLESIVRAAVIRYLYEHETEERAERETIRERNLGFLWMEELVPLLGVYEQSRAAYPTFRAFMPLVEGYYRDLSRRIATKAAKFEALLPAVASISPFANGAQDVSPTLTQLTINFDRPLDPAGGYSINFGPGGRERFPIEKVIGFDATGKSVTVQVKLQPDREYEFVLTGRSFRTKDGYPLRPYTVTFKTAK